MSWMASSDHFQRWLITAFVAWTIQLIRCAMELIQVASGPLPASSPPRDDTTTTFVSVPPSHTPSNGYGSTTPAAPPESTTAESLSRLLSASEREPLLSLSTGDDTEEDDAKSRERLARWRQQKRTLFLVLWMSLATGFGGFSIHTAILVASSQISITPSQSSISFPIILLLTASSLLLEAWLLYRDAEKERYGPIQRFLQHTACLLLWLVFSVPILSSSTSPSSLDAMSILLFTGATLVLILSVLDGYLTSRFTPSSRSRTSFTSDTKIASSKSSNRSAFVKLLRPYVWPDGSLGSPVWNRVRAICTWLCVILSKATNLYSPLLLGWATTALAHEQYGQCIRYACGYAFVSFAASTAKEGQSLLYLKVAQAAYVQLAQTAFAHLHSLSLDWHLRKKLGEVLRAMDRGISACDTLMKYLFLWLLPAAIECFVVCLIFATYFQYLPLALTVFYFVFLYAVWTILITLWRKKFRKALVQSDNEYHDIFTDSMINFETVKHFTAETFEKKRFVDAVARYQAGSTDVQASLSLLNISQQIILKMCLASALSLAAWGIRQRGNCCTETMGCESPVSQCCLNVSVNVCPGMQVGDFVAVLTYTLNLFAPLNFLGSIYNAVVMAIVDLSNMADLLAENPDIVDVANAIDLPPSNASDPEIAVEFDNVRFHYPSQPSTQGLRGLSFTMKRGTTTAIVGPTGAGKTTVSRLLFRFYDVLDGAVKVNGVNVCNLKQSSLRGAIGVVPQAASMFNETIRYNLWYGRRSATMAELEQAARDAQLLEFIESLAEGWDTSVGDRGLKLSGGEKQRAAIARCLLKDPPFVLLDEATSALDTITEKSVQDALDRLGAHRTVLVIAHRLGTIRNADNIIVLKDGQAAEQGTHDELLARNGIYAEMWNMQLHSTSSSRNNIEDTF